jgi:hypothetical protein
VGAFVVLGVIGILHHAMWRDETFPWLIARFSSSLRDLYLASRYDLQFMLWQVVLWILTRFTHSCQAMQWLHLALATCSVWVVVRFSPFPKLQKTLYCFGYFALFEYCLIARPYVWIGLLLFSLCTVCDRRRDSFVAQAVILFLLSNINVLGTIIAFSFVAASALEHIRRRDAGELWATRKQALILSGVILWAALIMVVLQSIKPKDALAFQGWPRPMTVSSFAATLCDVWRGYVPIPRPFPHFLNLIWGSNFLLDPAPRKLALGATLSLGLLAMSAWTLRRSPMAIAWYLFGTGLMLLFHFVISEAALRHDGLYFVLYVACLWCGFTWGHDQKPWSHPASLSLPLEGLFLSSILTIQVVAGVYAWTLHLMTPFSASKLAADFIRQHGYEDLLIIGSKDLNVSPVTAYLDQRIYYPECERYGTFTFENSGRHNLSGQELLRSAAQMAMKARGDTLLVCKGWLMISQEGVAQPLRSAWLSPDGLTSSVSKPPTEACMKISQLVNFGPMIVDESYSIYLISKP